MKAIEAGRAAIRADNLVLLCGHHHRLVHEGGFGAIRKADGSVVFRRPNGRVVPAVPSPARGSHKELRPHNRKTGLDTVPSAAIPLGRGEPFDRDLAVAGVVG